MANAVRLENSARMRVDIQIHDSELGRWTRAIAIPGGRHSWEAIARRCGYYDPSHLVGDFRQHMGESPTRLLALARPDHGSVVIADG